MSKLRSPISDYDRIVRIVSSYSNKDGGEHFITQYPKLLEFFESSTSEEQLESRISLAKKILYYRSPDNIEKYHERFLKIQTKNDGIKPFKWKKPQKVLFDTCIFPKIVDKKPIRIYILKARQIGFSTLIEGLDATFSSLWSDFKSSLIAHDKETSAKIFRMCKLFYKSLPPDFKPARKLSNRYELEFSNPIEDNDLGLESSITVNTAQNLHLGAGTTLHFLHLSEFARYEEVNSEAEKSIVTLMQSVPSKGLNFVFIETTAYGDGIGKRFWDNKENGFEKVFISWIAEEEYTHYEPLLDQLEYDDDSKFGNEVRVKDQIIDELKTWHPEYAMDSDWLIRETLCRLNWRREKILKDCFGKIELFHENYPITPEEAFKTTGRSVFNLNILSQYKSRVEDLISKQGPPPRYSYKPSGKTNVLGEFVQDPKGNLKIFSTPRQDHLYYLGVDTGSGVKDGDLSVVQIFNHLSRQCGIWRGLIEPDDLAYIVATLAKTYRNARVIPEANSMGIGMINKLIKDLKYTNVYIRETINNINGGITNEWGYYTSIKTRPILLNHLRTNITNAQIVLLDLDTIHEFMSFAYTIKKNRIKMDAPSGSHDDTIFATALATIDIPSIEEIINDREKSLPPDSIEAFARELDSNKNNYSYFGNVMGL